MRDQAVSEREEKRRAGWERAHAARLKRECWAGLSGEACLRGVGPEDNARARRWTPGVGRAGRLLRGLSGLSVGERREVADWAA